MAQILPQILTEDRNKKKKKKKPTQHNTSKAKLVFDEFLEYSIFKARWGVRFLIWSLKRQEQCNEQLDLNNVEIWSSGVSVGGCGK